MSDFLVQMPIVLRHHPGIRMAEKLRHLGDAHSVLQGLARVAVPVCVGHNALQVRQFLPQSAKTTTDRVFTEWSPQFRAGKQRPFGAFCDQSARHLNHLRVQIDHPRLTCLLTGFVLVENPHTEVKVHIRRCDTGNFRGAASGLVKSSEKIPKIAIVHCRKDFVPFGRSDDPGASPSGWLLDIPQRVWRENALLVGPVEHTLDSDHGVPLPSLPRAGIEPFGDVEWFQLTGREPPIEFAETLKEVLVPDIGRPLVVLF